MEIVNEKKSALILLFFSYLFSTLASMVSLYLTIYLKYKAYNSMEISIIYSAYASGSVVGTYIGGYVAQSRSTICINLYCRFASVILSIYLYSTTGLYNFSLTIFFLCLLVSACKPTFHYLLMSGTYKNKAGLISLSNVVMNVSISICAFVGVNVLNKLDEIFIFDSSMMAASLFFFVTYVLYAQGNMKTIRFNTIKKHRMPYDLYLMYFVVIVCFLILSQLKSTYPLIIKSRGLSNIELSNLYILNSMLVIFFEIPIVQLCKKFNIRAVLCMGCIFLGLGMSASMIVKNYEASLFFMIVFSLGEILFFPNSYIHITECQKSRSKNISHYQNCANISCILGPVGGFYLLSKTDSILLSYFHLIFGFMGVAVLFLISRRSFLASPARI